MAKDYSNNIDSIITPNVVDSNSRYDTKTRLKEGNDVSIRFIRNRDLMFNDNNSSIYVVQPSEEARPDIIASNCYGSETFAWIILSANGLKTEFEVVSGMKLIIPSLASLYGMNGKMITI